MKKHLGLLLLLLAAIFLYTFKLGELPLRDWDESIVATIAREIYRAKPSDLVWLYPQNLDGNPYWNKPPLVHNLIALSYQYFGVSDWSTRLIPALFGALCVPLLFLIAQEVFIARRAAYFSAAVYLTLIPVARHNRLAMLDGTITFWFCLSIWCLLKLKTKPKLPNQASPPSHQQLFSFLIGFSFAGICLSKGIAIALLLGLVLGSYALAERSYFSTLRSPGNLIWIAIGLSFVPIWFGLQYHHYGSTFLRYNLGTQAFSRITQSVESNSQPLWFYLLELLKYGLPWLIFLPGGLILAIKQKKTAWAKLTIIWLGIYFSAISLMSTKLPWYLIPVYPSIALLTGAKLSQLSRRKLIAKYPPYQTSFAILAIIFWLGFVYLCWWHQPQDLALILIALCLALTFTLTTILLRGQANYFIPCLLGGLYLTLLIFFNSHHSIWELSEAEQVKPIAQLIGQAVPPQNLTIYSSYPYYRPSLDFYSNHLVVPIAEIDLKTILANQKSAYFLTTKNYPSIANTKVIAENADWQIRMSNNIN